MPVKKKKKRAKKKKHVLIIDGKNFVWRAVSVQKNPILNPKTGVDCSGVINAAKMLTNLLDSWDPEAAFIVWDTATPSFKREMLPEYKTFRRINRFREDYMEQLNVRVDCSQEPIKELAEYAGFVSVSFPDSEADDLIAAMVYDETFLPDYKRIIITSDRDFLHLCDKASISLPRKHELLVTRDNFPDMTQLIFKLSEDCVFPWEGYLLFQSLNGDKGDDVAGYTGIGNKLASRIVNELWAHIGAERLQDFDEVKGALLKLPLDNVHASIKNKIRAIGKESKLLAFNWAFFDPHYWIDNHVGVLFEDYKYEMPNPDYEEFEGFCKNITLPGSLMYTRVFSRQYERTLASFDEKK